MTHKYSYVESTLYGNQFCGELRTENMAQIVIKLLFYNYNKYIIA